MPRGRAIGVERRGCHPMECAPSYGRAAIDGGPLCQVGGPGSPTPVPCPCDLGTSRSPDKVNLLRWTGVSGRSNTLGEPAKDIWSPGRPVIPLVERNRSPMCGLAGWVSFQRDLTAHSEIASAMTATMECRGPDAGGCGSTPRRSSATAGSPSSTWRAAAAHGASRTTARSRSSPTAARSTTSASCASELTRRGHEFRPPATPRSSCTPTWSGATASPSGSTACTPSPIWDPRTRSCC